MTQTRNVQQAMADIEAIVHRTHDQLYSKQPRFDSEKDQRAFYGSVMRWLSGAREEEPEYGADSRKRDEWLDGFWKKEPHLAGVLNSVMLIMQNTNWTLTGGRNQVIRYNAVLRHAEDGDGWRYLTGLQAQSYYTANVGAIAETGRDGPGGPLRALYHVDPTKCRMTGNRAQPLLYTPKGGDEQEWGADDFFRTVDMPSGREEMNGVGFCAVERCLELARLMVAIYQHDKEKLGAKAPKGLLLLQNIREDQWDTAMAAREAQLQGREMEYFGAVAVLASAGDNAPDAKLVALSQLPDGFNLETFTQLLMYGYALAFAFDPIEFWPVQAGSLGRGRETEIQHQKATGKGGKGFLLAYQDQLQLQLPDTLDFQFEERDDEGDIKRSQVVKAWAEAVSVLIQNGLPAQLGWSMLVEQGIIPPEWTEIIEAEQAKATEQPAPEGDAPADADTPDDQPDTATDSEDAPDEQRRRLLENERIHRALYAFPDEPVVRYTFDPARGRGRMRMLAQRGGDLLPQRTHWDLVQPRRLGVRRQDEDGVLYDGGDWQLTEEDVDRAIANARTMVGEDYASLLDNEPIRESEE